MTKRILSLLLALAMLFSLMPQITLTAEAAGESYTDTCVSATGEHSYDNGVCANCGRRLLPEGWLEPEFAQGDYSMVVIPDPQRLVNYWPEDYMAQMQWIADNRDRLNIRAVMHMGDMVDNSTDVQWETAKAGMDLIDDAGIPWMPMMGNHDESDWFNEYFDYETYGTDQSWFGGSYEEGKLDHTYWFVNGGQREYLILSLGWAPKWDVIRWAQGIVEQYPEKNVILNLHAYMNADGDLVTKRDLLAGMYGDYDVSSIPSSYLDRLMKDYPDSKEIRDTFSQYENVVMAACGHVHSEDIVTRLDTNAAGKQVPSFLFDRQNDDTKDRLGMLAVLTFHNDSDSVEVNWYSTGLNAMYREENQFTVSLPHVCSHAYEAVVTEPTCTGEGYTTYTCQYCGHSYTDSYVPVLSHFYSQWTVINEPGCTESGEQVRVCGVCGTEERQRIAPRGHDYGNWQVVRPSTCSKMGSECRNCKNCVVQEYRQIPMKDHSYDSQTLEPTCEQEGYTVHTCQVCGHSYKDSYVSPLGHSFGQWNIITEPTCAEYGQKERICGICGHIQQEYVPPVGHSYGQWTVIVHPNCTEEGYQSRVCSVCGATQTAWLKAYGHTYQDTVVKPTCVDEGYTIRTCTSCGYHYEKSWTDPLGHDWDEGEVTKEPTVYAEGKKTFHCKVCGNTKTESIPKLDHDHVYTALVTEPTCVEQGFTTFVCSCGETYLDDYTNATGHRYTAVVTAPTCTKNGYTTHTCTACGEHYEDTYVVAPGHKLEKWVTVTMAACTKEGQQKRICVNCDYFETQEIPAIGHNYDYVVSVPTCTTGGYVSHTCTNCAHRYFTDRTDPLGHKWDEGVVTLEPTEFEEGSMSYTCLHCAESKTEPIEKLEHFHSYTDEVKEPTCTEQGYTTHTCRCGERYTDGYVSALGHSYQVKVTAPTCTEEGFTTHLCTRCEYSYQTDTVSALGHNWDEGVITSVTCTEGGYTTYTCQCGAYYVDDEVSALGHSFTEYVSNGDATCLEDGTRTAKCDRCDETDTKADPGSALGHSYDTLVTEPTCTQQGYTTHFCHCGDSFVDSNTSALGHHYLVTVYEVTCTTDGYTTHWCGTCGDYYVSDEKTALGHSYEVVVTDPTCTAEGCTTHTCANCGDSFVTDVTAALGHAWDDGTVTLEPTEDTQGERTFLCETCGEARTESIPALEHVHTYEKEVMEPTCTEGGYTVHTCRCGDWYETDETQALGHGYSDWFVVEAPTCTENGEQVRECVRCASSQSRIVKATGHSYDSVVTEPDCLTGGYTTFLCGSCGHSYEGDEVPALGHAYEPETFAPTCTEVGYTTYTCARCGDHYDGDQVDPTGHSYQTEIVEATCTDGGCTVHTCAVCFDSYADSETPALGHSWDEGVITLEPTEDKEGERTFTCGTCGGVEIRFLPRLDHVHSYEAVVTEPGCTTPGFTAHICRCGDRYVTDETQPLGHDFGDWYVYEDSTCTSMGEQRQDCGRCDAFLTGTIELKPHSFTSYVSNDNATCTTESTKTAICDNCTMTDTVAEPGTAKGHRFSGWSVLRPATYTREGEKVRICVVCGTMEKRPIPKLVEFTDVDQEQFYAEPITWAMEQGITNGISETEFGPDDQCTRNQIVTFLWRAAGSPEPTSLSNPFIDVKNSDYFYEAVLWAVEKGITTGLDADHFGPNETCTRAQVAVFLWRAKNEPTPGSGNPFTDIAPGQWFYESVLWAVEAGVTKGISPTEFGPDQVCTRGQIVTFLYRALEE